MKSLVSFLLAFSLVVLFATGAPAGEKKLAPVKTEAASEEKPETKKAPTRETLISFWEEKNINDEDVKQFEKTGEKNVYKFETAFFPYQGRLKLLNAVITKSSDTYMPDLYTGIIEVELLDAPEDFFTKYAASYGAWSAQNYFYYDGQKGVWFPSSEWSAYAASNMPVAAPSSGRHWNIVWLFALVAGLGGIAYFAKVQNQKIWDNHQKALKEQQRGLKIAEESLELQKEHSKLLKEIASALKKK